MWSRAGGLSKVTTERWFGKAAPQRRCGTGDHERWFGTGGLEVGPERWSGEVVRRGGLERWSGEVVRRGGPERWSGW